MRARKPNALALFIFLAVLGCCAGAAWAAGDLRFPPGDAANGPATGTQLTPAIAAGDDGYLAAWQDYRSSPFSAPPFSTVLRGVDIYARRLDGNGVPIGPAIAIATGFGDQTAPQVAWNGENWLVAWETPCECWSFSSQVQAVRVSPEGVILDPAPIIVHTNASEWFRMTSNGSEWLVVLDSLRGIRISASGQLINPGGTQLVVRTTTGRHSIVSAQGEYLLVWDSWGAAQGQRFAPDLTPIGNPFSVPSVNLASSGQDYFAVWIIDDTYWDDFVYGRRIDLDGSPGAIVTIAGTGGGLPLWNPAQIAVGWDGTNWWTSWLQTAGGTVFARVTPGGTVLDFGGVSVDPTTASHAHYAPAVAGRPTGGAQFVWQDKNADGGFYDIVSGAVDAAGVAAATEVVSSSSRAQFFVDLAAGTNEIMAVYRSEHSGDRAVMARRFDADGNALDAAPILVHSSPDVGPPAVGFDGTRYMAVWSEGTQVYGKRLQTDGSVIDAAPFPVMEGSSPDVAGLGGDFLVVSRRRTTGEHVFQPFSMRVDGATGATLDPDTMAIGGSYARIPRVIAFGGRWLAVWQRNFTHDNPNSDVRGAFIETNGSTTGDFVVASSGGEPDAAAAGDTALVVWRTGSPGYDNDIHARFLAFDGTLSPALTVSADQEDESEPVVAWNGTEFVVAWSDKRNSIIYFDGRTEVYAARVQPDGTVVDPRGFAFGDRAQPEIDPAVASLDGRTLTAASSFRDESEHGIYRFAYEVLPAGNRWPVAVASATPIQGDVPLVVGFDSTGSADPDGTVAAYAWDFGDGAVDGTPNPTHAYTTPGNYLARLEVTDDQGRSTRNVVRVVAEAVNQIPIAVPAADVTAGDPPLAVVFNARDSYDPDQGIQNWEWDFGDGWDYWGSTAYHTFTTDGVYTVTLYVHDFRGGTGSETMTISVGQPNEDPVAAAAASLLGGPAPLRLGFDGTASFDPDGTIVSWNWSFGDGNSASGAAPLHMYSLPGTYTATLTVTDDRGGTAIDPLQVEVVPGNAAGWTTADVATPSGWISAGSHMDTHDQNDVAEALTEELTAGEPTQQTSRLEHVWTLDVAPDNYQTFHVDAHHTPNGEGDDFVFEYSRDQLVWTPMLGVSGTADVDVIQEYWFTEDVAGTLYVRVRDTDETPGNNQTDTLFVDEMYVMSTPSLDWVGSVPDSSSAGQPLALGKNTDGSVALSWGDSCMVSDTDYAVYEGPLGAFSQHLPVLCSTGGSTNATLGFPGGSTYYLVVARDDAYEGSHGTDGSGSSRGAGPVQCRPSAATLECP